MKKLFTTAVFAVLIATATTLKAQDQREDYLGLPGDNLNLYAVMDLFRNSATLEGFERSLNDENSRINNLDLNGDNLVDYIMVSDYVDGDVHNIVLRVALNKNENQDVAVFTVQPLRNGSVQIQLTGDEALYGKNYIIEPNYADNKDETPNPGYAGRSADNGNITEIPTSAREIAAWPLVSFLFLPDYIAWRSGWYWGYWPANWMAWHPWYWHYYYGYHYNHFHDCFAYYRPWHLHRYAGYNDFYFRGIRSHSRQVSDRISRGQYSDTYSRPEMRKEGEALSSGKNGGMNGRTGETVNNRSNERISGSQVEGTTQRSGETVTGKSATIPSDNRVERTSRSSSSSVDKKTSSRSQAAQRTTNQTSSHRESVSSRPSRQMSGSGNSPRADRRSSGSMSTSRGRGSRR